MKPFLRRGGRRLGLVLLFLVALSVARLEASEEDLARKQAEAAKFYSEQSYALAHQAWSEAAKLAVPESERPTLEFYLADSLWRSRPTPEQVDSARAQLGKLAGAEVDSPLAAEAAESLGDLWLAIEGDWERAWTEYRRALKFWAAQTDVETARARYLGIVWKATGPPDAYGWNREVPAEVLANALSIAPNNEERARAHFFLGARSAREEDPFSQRRALQEFAAAMEEGPATAVYETALFRLAAINLTAGRAEWGTDGSLVLRPDYARALELFRRFLREYPEGKSELFAAAKERTAEITRSELTVRVEGQFLPGSRPVVSASWRNVDEVTFSLTRVELGRDFQPSEGLSPDAWLAGVKTERGAVMKTWKEPSTGGAAHAPTKKRVELDPITEPGTYLVEARSAGRRARALVTVTSGAAILNNLGDTAIAFFCDAQTGARAEEIAARLWRAQQVDGKWRWIEAKAGETRDGTVRFDWSDAGSMGGDAILLAMANGQPSVTVGRTLPPTKPSNNWRVQVFTDRAAYRPGDKVSWKLISRRGRDGEFETPAGEQLGFTITDPAGQEVQRGEVKLTAFGGAWGELVPKSEAALGEYEIVFRSGAEEVGRARLFRLEEYRLPEFKVGVNLAGGGTEGVRLGDEVEVKVHAEYYFGGAVADAKVEVRVREEPLIRPMLRDGLRAASIRRGGDGKVIRSETVRTGPDGGATVRFVTPVGASEDLRYVVEVRVADASGREVVGTGELVVARQRYFSEAKTSRRVVVPGDRVDVSVETADANGRKVATRGALAISRQRWVEVWLDPRGREVSGEALDQLRRGIFPPPNDPGWRLVRQNYVDEKIADIEMVTDDHGQATHEFKPSEEGFYRLAWSSPDADGPPVTAETHVWVSSNAGGMIGYRSGGVEVIADPAAPARGEKAPVLITADTPNRDVLLLVHADGNLFRSEVVHLEGNARLIEIEPDERFTPNVFVSVAAMRGLEYFADARSIKFPPVRNALRLELAPAEGEFRPGTETVVNLTVTNAEGRPVRGEFAVSVSDEAIDAVQAEYGEDPLTFFLGRKRANRLAEASSVSRAAFQREPTVEAEIDRSPSGRRKNDSARVTRANSVTSEMVALATETEEPPVTVRSDFSATAFWRPNVLTDENGRASVRFRYPDSLTTWRTVVRGTTAGTEFGWVRGSTRTSLPLVARLQAPRFLVAGDRLELGAVIHNRTNAGISANVGLKISGLGGATKAQTLRVPAHGDGRATWALKAETPGVAEIGLTAEAGANGDALTGRIPVHPNGISKTVVVGGKSTSAESRWALHLPTERRRGAERLTITATPSLAGAALDALPYLVAFPYGCVEQTMSRFLPAAVTARTLQSLGLDREAVTNRMFEGVESRNPDRPLPKLEGVAGLEELDRVIAQGLARLRDFQNGEGAWGWWNKDESDPFMTAYVLWGLRLAQQAGVPIRSGVVKAGSEWLRKHLVDARSEPNLQAWMLHALAVQRDGGATISEEERAALENLWASREQLSAYGRALLTLSAHFYGDTEKARTLARNLRDGVIRDATAIAPGGIPTAHWGSEGMFRRWEDGGVEATAFALQALLAVEPQSDLIEPAVNWLVKNRRGAHWSNTRDTAIALLSINRFLAVTKELGKPATFDVMVNGQKAGEAKGVTALGGQSRFEVDPALLRDGKNEILIRGDASNPPIYVSARAEFFTLEEPIPAAGNEISVRRDYALFTPLPTLLDGYRFDRRDWKIGEAAARDQRVEVTLTVEARNDLEYVLVEDLKPAGLEAPELQSGGQLSATGAGGRTLPVYCELRDRKVALFLRRLPAGTWTIRYELRTETVGDFSALPVMGEAMYASEIRANGESRRVEIR